MAIWREAGLRAKIDPDKGPELVVYKDDGLPLEQIIRMQIGMLENNSISGTLPLRYEVHDGAVSLRYSISGMRRLRSALSGAAVRAEQWDGLLAAIGLALREGADYCVRETEYVLDPDWIWVRRDVRDLKLAAVPVVGFGSPERAWKQWKSLFDCMVEHGLPEWWRDRLNPTQWEPSTFSHRLWMEAEADADRKHDEYRNVGNQFAPVQVAPASHVIEGKVIERNFYQGNSVIGKEIREADDGETMRFSAPRMSRQEWLRLIVATVCCIVFVWSPSLPALFVACLGCIPLGVTLYRRYAKERDGGHADDQVQAQTQEVPFADTSFAASAAVSGFGTDPAPLANRTLVLSTAQETVLLTDLKDKRQVSELEIAYEESDRVEIVSLFDGKLRLGRGPTGVDIVVDHAAASRVHLEFDAEEGRPRACDLGSTNGTYYMDRVMTPHERYELQDGDLLRLPGAVIRVILHS